MNTLMLTKLSKRIKSPMSFFIFVIVNYRIMKKIVLALIVLFVASFMFSCKSSHRCAAYSKADVKSMQKPS